MVAPVALELPVVALVAVVLPDLVRAPRPHALALLMPPGLPLSPALVALLA